MRATLLCVSDSQLQLGNGIVIFKVKKEDFITGKIAVSLFAGIVNNVHDKDFFFYTQYNCILYRDQQKRNFKSLLLSVRKILMQY